MPVNKNAYLRYIHIHSQIKRNKYKPGYPNKQHLLWSLEDEGMKVSGATLEKDLAFLRYQRGAPIIYDADQKCYRYEEDWEFDIPLTPEVVRMIRMLIHKLQPFGEAQEFKMIKDAIDQVSEHFSLSQRHSDDNFNKYILFEYTKGFAGRHNLPVIYDAIFESREIEFTHCKFGSEESTRRVLRPYIIKEHRNRWYVIGKENGESRIFGLERISDLVVTDNYFAREDEFYDEIFEVLHDSVGVMAFGYPSEEVVLEFDKTQAAYVETLMLHRSQVITPLEDGRISVSMKVKVNREFTMECILRFGEHVKVVKPGHLAVKVKEIHQKALGNY